MESQPHILFISSWYPNRNDSTHGIFNQHFVQAASRYHKVSVLHVCFDKNIHQNRELVSPTVNGVFTQYVYIQKVRTRIPFLSQWLKRLRLLNAYEEGFQLLIKERGIPQLIQLNVVLPAGIGVLHLHQKYSIPFVVNEGWTGYMKEDGSYRGFFTKYFTHKILQSSSCILPVSKDLQEAMISQGLKGKYKIVPNVIQTEVFKPLSNSAQNKAIEQTFIHVSTFDPRQKNGMGILRAFAKALKKMPELRLILVGDAGEKTEVSDFITQNQLQSKVHTIGKKNAEELAVLFNQCKALIMFSNYESFGVVIGEALACGLPVICSKAGGLSNALSQEVALLVQPKNEEELFKAITKVAKDEVVFDKQVLRDFVTRHYSEEAIALQLKEIYQEVLNQNPVRV